MLTDRQNRPLLAFSLGVYAFLMGLMALASYARPIGGVPAVILICLIFAMLITAVIGGMAWLGDAPFIRTLHGKRTNLHDAVTAVLYLFAIALMTFGAIAAWCSESTSSYAIAFVLTGAATLHQYVLVKREGRPRDACAFPSARLVR